MRIFLFCVLALIAIRLTKANVRQKKVSSRLSVQKVDENSKDLLSTLLELHHSLITQIAVLEKTSPSAKDPDMVQLLQHYTAQKDNIEREISLIQTIEADPKPTVSPRHILKDLVPEEKFVPSLLNIFRKKNPNPTQSSDEEIEYSVPYHPYYTSAYDSHYPYPYHKPETYQPPPPIPPSIHSPSRPPLKPTPSSLIEDTFPGYKPTQHNPEHQAFVSKEPQQPIIEDLERYKPQSGVTIQPEVQPPKYNPQPQIYMPKPEGQKPSGINIRRGEVQNQINQGQNQGGVLVYYPDAVITENDDNERLSIADRVGQAIDRFGQVISSLSNRQNTRNPILGTDTNPKIETSRKRNSRPRSSGDEREKARTLVSKRLSSMQFPDSQKVSPRRLETQKQIKNTGVPNYPKVTPRPSSMQPEISAMVSNKLESQQEMLRKQLPNFQRITPRKRAMGTEISHMPSKSSSGQTVEAKQVENTPKMRWVAL